MIYRSFDLKVILYDTDFISVPNIVEKLDQILYFRWSHWVRLNNTWWCSIYSDGNTVTEIFFSHSLEWSHLSVSSDVYFRGHNLFIFQKLFIINSKMNFLFLFFSYALSDQIAWNRLGNNSKNKFRTIVTIKNIIEYYIWCFLRTMTCNKLLLITYNFSGIMVKSIGDSINNPLRHPRTAIGPDRCRSVDPWGLYRV